MRNHPGAFRGFFSTLAAATFLAMTLSSCAVTVALPGGGSTTTPIKPPTNIGPGTGAGASGGGITETKPAPSEPTTGDGDDGENNSDQEPSTKDPSDGIDDTSKKPTEGQPINPEQPKDPSESETKPKEKPALPQPGDGMIVPNGYKATWILEGNTLVLRTYTIPRGSDVNVELPTGGRYKIGDSAFAEESRIASIRIPEDVIEIGNYAFTGTWLTAVEIPETVKVIGDYAFAQTQLQNVTLKGNYAPGQLGEYAFANCEPLENVTFTGTAAELSKGIFSCTGIISFTLPKGLQTIHANAFDYTYLSELYIPRSVTKIDLSAFDNTIMTINYQGSAKYRQEATGGTKLSEPKNVKVNFDCENSTSDAFSLLSNLLSIF